MGPRVSVCRKGENIFLTIEGETNGESLEELFAVVRQLLLTSLKCIAPGASVTYSLKTRGTVDLEKMTQFQRAIEDHPCGQEGCGGVPTGQKQGVAPPQGEPAERRPRNGLFLVRGGAV